MTWHDMTWYNIKNGEAGTVAANDYMKGDTAFLFVTPSKEGNKRKKKRYMIYFNDDDDDDDDDDNNILICPIWCLLWSNYNYNFYYN